MLLTDSKLLPYYKRKMKCPKHFVKLPGREGFKMELDPNLRNITFEQAKKYGVSKLKAKRYPPNHKWAGQKIYEPKDYYQPEMSCAFLIENVYDGLNPICRDQCRGRCKEGFGHNPTATVKRLHG